MELEKALIYTQNYYELTKPYFKKFDITGSLRRQAEDINTLEYIVIPNSYEFDDYLNNQKKKGLLYILNRKWNTRDIIIDKERMKLTFYLANTDNFGLIQFMTTGTKEYARETLKEWMKWSGGFYGNNNLLNSWSYTNNPYLWNNDNKRISVPDEETLYRIFRKKWIRPDLRYSNSEKKKLSNKK